MRCSPSRAENRDGPAGHAISGTGLDVPGPQACCWLCVQAAPLAAVPQPVLLPGFNSIHSDLGPAMQPVSRGLSKRQFLLEKFCGKQYQCCAEVQEDNFSSLSSSMKWVTLSQKEMELVR